MSTSLRRNGDGFRPNDATSGAMFFCAWIAFVLVFLVVTFVYLPKFVLPIFIPFTTTLLIASGFFLGIARRHQWNAPIFHVGSFYAAVVLIYTIYPLAVFIRNGQRYHILSDIRLFAAQPEPQEIATVAWWYVIYFATFCLVYFVSTRSVGSIRIDPPARSGSLLFVVILIYTAVQAYLWIVTKVFGGGAAATYHDTYLALRHLPLIVQQVTGRLQSWTQVIEIVLLVVFFTDYKRNRFLIVMMLLWVGASTFMKMHARTELFMLLIAAAFLRHHFVRRMRLMTVVIGGVALLTLFSILGAVRNISDTEVELSAMMRGTSEFESILATAHDLMFIRKDAGVFLENPVLYFADFILFIPSQLLPFTKQIASNWYMERYYPWVGEAGGGFAFGAISEAIVGFGLIELIVRAALLALIFAWIDRRFTAGRVSTWGAAFYVWLAVMAYMSFRVTTFTLITSVLQLFAVPIVLLQISFALWIRFSSDTRKSNSAIAAQHAATSD